MTQQAIPQRFSRAVHAATADLGIEALAGLGYGLLERRDRQTILAAFAGAEPVSAAERILDSITESALDAIVAGGYIAGVAEALGDVGETGRPRVEVVWSGPATARIPVRATAQVIVDVLNGARSEVLLMTYSAKPYQPLIDALSSAVGRGVRVSVVVETLQGAAGAMSGSEPAAAFAAVQGITLWHWPPGARGESGAKMHAKLLVADSSILLTTSANLTESGVGRNIEAGLLVRGGAAPRRAAEHVRELQATSVLKRYY